MEYISGGIKVHPRKRVPHLPHHDAYGREFPTELSQVYGRYSRAKELAYRECVELCRELGGRNFRITSANTFSFSVAFEISYPDTGELMVVRITPCNRDAYFVE